MKSRPNFGRLLNTPRNAHELYLVSLYLEISISLPTVCDIISIYDNNVKTVRQGQLLLDTLGVFAWRNLHHTPTPMKVTFNLATVSSADT